MSQVCVAMSTAKQQGNRTAATRFLRSWIIQNGRIRLSRYDMSVSFSHTAGFIWMYFWGGHEKTKKINPALRVIVLCVHVYRDNNRKKIFAKWFYLLITKLLKWSYHNDKPSRLKRRWVTMFDFLTLTSLRVPYIVPELSKMLAPSK